MNTAKKIHETIALASSAYPRVSSLQTKNRAVLPTRTRGSLACLAWDAANYGCKSGAAKSWAALWNAFSFVLSCCGATGSFHKAL